MDSIHDPPSDSRGGGDRGRIRTATDFVAAFVNLATGPDGNASALRGAAHAVQGPGGEDLRVLVDFARWDGWASAIERLSQLATEWGTPVLESLAVALRTSELVREPMRNYLLACAQAEACAAVQPSPPPSGIATAA